MFGFRIIPTLNIVSIIYHIDKDNNTILYLNDVVSVFAINMIMGHLFLMLVSRE